jgi:hypothetical protein
MEELLGDPKDVLRALPLSSVKKKQNENAPTDI